MPLLDLSAETHAAVLAALPGHEAVNFCWGCRAFAQLLKDDALWATCTQQEFDVDVSVLQASTPLQVYRSLYRRAVCRHLRWARAPCQHSLGMRGAHSPAVFCHRGCLFVFGGRQHRPENDLHGGVLAMPLVLRRIELAGSAPPPASRAAVAALANELRAGEPRSPGGGRWRSPLRVAVTGGRLPGGVQADSDQYGLLDISKSAGGTFRAEWVAQGAMSAPRSGHTATFVPPSVAGPGHPRGYLLLIGGMQRGNPAGTADVLDLETLAWRSCIPGSGAGSTPPRFLRHSATLLHRPGVSDAAVLVVGRLAIGEDGVAPSGEPESQAFWLTGLDGAQLHWSAPIPGCRAPFASHVACRLRGTGSVLLVGDAPHAQGSVMAFAKGGLRAVPVGGQAAPEPRTFGGGCPLPDGSALLYGGSDRQGRVFDDIWVAHTGMKTDFFLQVQKELSFLTKMHRRVRSLRRQMDGDDSSDEGGGGYGARGGVDGALGIRGRQELLDDLMADLAASGDDGECADGGGGHPDDSSSGEEPSAGPECSL